jgi:hypothetical protein
VSLDPEAIERLELLGNGNLSAGVAIAEHMTRGLPPLSSDQIRTRTKMLVQTKPGAARTWIVFELVDGPPDPPPGGEQLDAWRTT